MSTIPVKETTRIARFAHNLYLFFIPVFHSQRKNKALYSESDPSWYANCGKRVRDLSQLRVARVFAFSYSIKGGKGGNYSHDCVFIYFAMEMQLVR